MLSAEQKTIDALKASTALTALVGSGDKLRIYPDIADENANTPYVEFERAAAEPVIYLDLSRAPINVTIVVTTWADSRVEAGTIAALIEDAMSFAGHTLRECPADYIPALHEYAAARAFDVWENI